MKDNIYTIPLTDALNSGHECPFCYIYNNIESDTIEFMLGSAYMADNIREKTNKLGFCSKHYELLYNHGNRLGLALIMHTHLQELKNNLYPMLKDYDYNNKKNKPSIFGKKHSTSKALDYLLMNKSNCYICNKINSDMERYLETLFFIWKREPKIKDLVKNCKGFCLSHFADILNMAPKKLSSSQLTDFYDIIIPLTQDNLDRVIDELSWFIDKYDYRNKDRPWKNSKDAVPRSIQKLASIYVGKNKNY